MDFEHIRRKYKDRMLQIAFVASGWSPEKEGNRHGCVLALEGKYPIAVGFNGPDRNWKLEGKDCGGSCCKAPNIHAEVNAILNAQFVGADLSKCVAFVTKKPCRPCYQALTQAGIKAIFWLQDCSGGDCGWVEGEPAPSSFGTYAQA